MFNLAQPQKSTNPWAIANDSLGFVFNGFRSSCNIVLATLS